MGCNGGDMAFNGACGGKWGEHEGGCDVTGKRVMTSQRGL